MAITKGLRGKQTAMAVPSRIPLGGSGSKGERYERIVGEFKCQSAINAQRLLLLRLRDPSFASRRLGKGVSNFQRVSPCQGGLFRSVRPAGLGGNPRLPAGRMSASA
ncbi:MAG: hypothetical protein CM1200mP20_01020 [Pseudomonadota bacterium]|nr:MAG: hypothetical protein CM1200mP20_01020 [Pseudomonadota bacterium]